MINATAWRAGARTFALVFVLLSSLAGCATGPTNSSPNSQLAGPNDPFEPVNRKIFALNQVIDEIIIKPVVAIYVTLIPRTGRNAIRRVLDNLKEPVIAINDTLQGQLKDTGISLGRFVVNSTAGIGGLIDVANKWGLPKESGDFGQTLYTWGVPAGPYLVLPILGPSNPRDAIGMGIDAYMDPFAYLATTEAVDELQITRFVLGGVDERARVRRQLDELQKNSLDYYAELRSLAEQHRAAQLHRGKAVAPPTPKNFYDVPSGPAPAAKSPGA